MDEARNMAAAVSEDAGQMVGGDAERRRERRRSAALHMAASINSARGIDAEHLISDAKKIEAYLTGQDQGPQPPPETKGDEIDASAVTDAIKAEDARTE